MVQRGLLLSWPSAWSLRNTLGGVSPNRGNKGFVAQIDNVLAEINGGEVEPRRYRLAAC